MEENDIKEAIIEDKLIRIREKLEQYIMARIKHKDSCDGIMSEIDEYILERSKIYSLTDKEKGYRAACFKAALDLRLPYVFLIWSHKNNWTALSLGGDANSIFKNTKTGQELNAVFLYELFLKDEYITTYHPDFTDPDSTI